MLSPDARRRIEQTVSCRDADAIPKVANAGAIEERDGVTVQVMHNGVLVEAGGYHGDWMTEVITRLRGHHEPQEERAFHALVERLAADTPTPRMIELGSFWSYYSLWLQRAIPGADCTLVEPDPGSLALGRRNVALNGARARFIQAAVGDPHGSVAPFTCESDGVTRDVARVTIDGLLDGARADLIHCDTQGAELEALHGAASAIADGRVRFVVVSTHHHAISGDPLIHQKCLAFLTERGAQVIAEHSVYESCSGDGLIVASFDARDAGFEVPISHVRARDTLFGEPEAELAAALARIAELSAAPPPPSPRRRFWG